MRVPNGECKAVADQGQSSLHEDVGRGGLGAWPEVGGEELFWEVSINSSTLTVTFSVKLKVN